MVRNNIIPQAVAALTVLLASSLSAFADCNSSSGTGALATLGAWQLDANGEAGEDASCLSYRMERPERFTYGGEASLSDGNLDVRHAAEWRVIERDALSWRVDGVHSWHAGAATDGYLRPRTQGVEIGQELVLNPIRLVGRHSRGEGEAGRSTLLGGSVLLLDRDYLRIEAGDDYRVTRTGAGRVVNNSTRAAFQMGRLSLDLSGSRSWDRQRSVESWLATDLTLDLPDIDPLPDGLKLWQQRSVSASGNRSATELGGQWTFADYSLDVKGRVNWPADVEQGWTLSSGLTTVPDAAVDFGLYLGATELDGVRTAFTTVGGRLVF